MVTVCAQQEHMHRSATAPERRIRTVCRWRVQLAGAAQNGFWAVRSLESEGLVTTRPAEVRWSPRWIRAAWSRSPRSGDQDELSADVAALADAVGLGSAVERECLHLDHQLVLCQQFGCMGLLSAPPPVTRAPA